MDDKMEDLLFDIFNMSIDKETCFSNNDVLGYSFLSEHIRDNYEVLIDDNYFKTIKEAINYLIEHPTYNKLVFNNNDYKFVSDELFLERMYNNILDKKNLSNGEQFQIIKLLSDRYLEDNDMEDNDVDDDYDDEDELKSEEQVDEYCNFIKENDNENITEKFKNDEEFGFELIDNYFCDIKLIDSSKVDHINMVELEKEINPKLKKVMFVNEIYRQIIIDIYDRLVANSMKKESIILFIYSYLMGDISFSDEFYKKYFGNEKVNIPALLEIQKLLIISDFYKYCNFNNNNNSYTQNYIDCIECENIENIVTSFYSDLSFIKMGLETLKVVNENSRFKNLKLNNEKTLKKINPLYTLDKMSQNIF